MTPAARIAAAVEILDRWLAGEPAEKCLTNWGRANRFAGSGDRAAIRDHVFDAIRCRRSFAAAGGGETGRGLMIGKLREAGERADGIFTGTGHAPSPLTPEELSVLEEAKEDLPDAVRLDIPDWLEAPLRAGLGEDFAPAMALMRGRAPVHLRVNLLKSRPDDVLQRLAEEGIEARRHPLSPTAVEVDGHARRVRSSSALRDGLIELQDAASQAVVDVCCPLTPGTRVLDFCAGGGGKALAFAGAGAEVVAHDADPRRMSDLPARAARAGAEIRIAYGADLARLAPFDLVFADAPCSGSGAWRRQPEAKWLLTPARLAELNRMQDEVLDAASGFVGPDGRLGYATCSLLTSENRGAVDRFLLRHRGWELLEERRMTPLDGGDGFYVALLKAN